MTTACPRVLKIDRAKKHIEEQGGKINETFNRERNPGFM
jgi:hypothetical protein